MDQLLKFVVLLQVYIKPAFADGDMLNDLNHSLMTV